MRLLPFLFSFFFLFEIEFRATESRRGREGNKKLGEATRIQRMVRILSAGNIVESWNIFDYIR